MAILHSRSSSSRRLLARFAADESGATAIEYAMIASGVGATIASTVYLLGDRVKALFTTVSGLLPG
jgi:pilus assembly protein Flp/PilA